MPAGTITLKNNSAAVTGSGTAFSTELKANDFIVVTVGQTVYTLGIKSVESNTSLTLVRNFDGPSASGLAWTPIPYATMVSITAQTHAYTAEALRGLLLDKRNWQQLFSGTGDVTVTLPDNSSFTGPAWNGITKSLEDKLSKSSNLSDLQNKKMARGNLGLGSAATANIGANQNEVMIGGGWGLGGSWRGYALMSTNNVNPILNDIGERGLIAFRNNQEISDNGPGWYTPAWGPSLWCRTEDVYAAFNMASTTTHLSVSCGSIRTGWTMHKVIWHSLNTVVDGNGFIKKASPVTNIFGDGSCENNMESEGVICNRLGVGVYHVDGCLGFYIDNGWKFEVPKDENGNALLWVDYKVEKDGSIVFKTYHRTNECPIPELQNNVEGYNNGDPIDIPEGKFLMVRLNVPNSQCSEYVPDDSIPQPFNDPDGE